jgi:hypothetical protein
VAAYARAVPARLCLLTALINQEAKPDSIITVAQAALDVSPANQVALGALADALDTEARATDAAPIWQRLVATDTMNADLLDRVVSALSREGSAAIAQPLIDRGTALHAENLRLLKLRWLVHLATSDWKGAVSTGEELMARDAATQADPEFFARLAAAYKADSQPMHALAIAATGVSKFPNDAPLYITYLQLLKTENDAALTRGLSSFPENPELHAFAAQILKTSGNAAGALTETKRALAANPRLSHGYLQLAQLEVDVGEIDSAFAHLEQAQNFGETPRNVAQFALARGNAFYKNASASQKREDYQLAIKFLALATRVAPTPESHFLLGASNLSVSQSAAMEGKSAKSCELTKLADSSLTEAEMNLISGGSVAPDAARQYLDYVAKLKPFVSEQAKTLCGASEANQQRRK